MQTNPISNLSSLESLIGETKLANQRNEEFIKILTELFMNALLPADRKLFSIQLRGADLKKLDKSEIDKKLKNKILAYWWFENELKEHYFNFLRNIQICSTSGKDNIKCCTVVITSKLLSYSPEKEQMLLQMLINKLGDPVGKVAGKAMYHLLEVAYKHPNMCGVITKEAEKLLFRNNISEKAQHFALSFLSQISSRADSDVCTKLVDICFKFFKILIEKGDVNNKTMQAILRCLRHAIADAKINEDGTVIPKDTLDTIYRVIHLAEINISLQALSLILQVISIKSGKHDRFYNALYMKLLDANLPHVGHHVSSLFFYIIHRAIHIDSNIPRCKAMLKRFLQISLYFPAPKICATLIVIDKLMKARPDLRDLNRKKLPEVDYDAEISTYKSEKPLSDDDDDDGEERYNDVDEENEKKPSHRELSKSSWDHSQLNKKKQGKKTFVSISNDKKPITQYDLNCRNPMYAGSEYTLNYELLKLLEHFHPTVQVFANSILTRKSIAYKGDPLKDFALPQFLDRFSFKNPKAIAKPDEKTFIHRMFKDKSYKPMNSRNIPVKSLSTENCTEEEFFIFKYLDKKRELTVVKKDDDEESIASVDDDEFDAYLDTVGAAKDFEEDDYLDEITENINKKTSKKKNKNVDDNDDDDVDYFESDEEGENNDEGDSKKKKKNNKLSQDVDSDDDDFGSDDGSISLDEDMSDGSDNDDDAEVMTFSDDGDDDVPNGNIKNGKKDSKTPKNNKKTKSNKNDSDSDHDDLLSIDEDFDSQSDGSDSFEDSDEDAPPSKKSKIKPITAKDFQRKMKDSTDMRSLFASADDFADLLEETGKSKRHGTLNDVYNKDKSSDKQLAWEAKRQTSSFKRKNWSNKTKNQKHISQKPSKKRKR